MRGAAGGIGMPLMTSSVCQAPPQKPLVAAPPTVDFNMEQVCGFAVGKGRASQDADCRQGRVSQDAETDLKIEHMEVGAFAVGKERDTCRGPRSLFSLSLSRPSQIGRAHV